MKDRSKEEIVRGDLEARLQSEKYNLDYYKEEISNSKDKITSIQKDLDDLKEGDNNEVIDRIYLTRIDASRRWGAHTVITHIRNYFQSKPMGIQN